MSDAFVVFFSFAIMIPEFFILLLLWSGLVEFRKNKAVTWITIIALLLIASVLTNVVIENTYIKMILIFIVDYFILKLFYVGKWYMTIFSAVAGVVLLKGIDNIVLYGTAILFNLSPNELLENNHSFIVLALLSKTLEFILAWIFREMIRTHAYQLKPYWRSWLQTLPLPLASCLLMTVSISISISSPESSPMLLLLTLIFLTLSLIQLFIAKKLDKQKYDEEENKQLQQAIRLQKRNMQSLSETYSVQRRMTHDYNGHIAIISELLQQKHYDEVNDYVAGLCETSQGSAIVVHTHNVIIDAVLNQKYRIATAENIVMDFDLTNLEVITLPCEEIAIVLSNLLDNAIEACIKCPKKRLIRIKARLADSKMLLMITNTAVKAPVELNGELQTSKDNSSLHGFGLRNIKSILDVYGAEYTMDYENGLFSFVAFIPIVTTPI